MDSAAEIESIEACAKLYTYNYTSVMTVEPGCLGQSGLLCIVAG